MLLLLKATVSFSPFFFLVLFKIHFLSCKPFSSQLITIRQNDNKSSAKQQKLLLHFLKDENGRKVIKDAAVHKYIRKNATRGRLDP
jgi:hypothetical protein